METLPFADWKISANFAFWTKQVFNLSSRTLPAILELHRLLAAFDI